MPGTGFSSHPSGAQKIQMVVLPKGLILLRRIGLFCLSALANKLARVQTKKPLRLRQRDLCARDWIRTSTWFPTLRPEHSASTNFATRAGGKCRRIQGKEKMIPSRGVQINASMGFILDCSQNHLYKLLKINPFPNLQIFKFPNYFRIFAAPK